MKTTANPSNSKSPVATGAASAIHGAAADGCPPSSNTGGTIGHINSNATKIDWLSFTFDQKLDIEEYVSGFSALFELNDLEVLTDNLGRGQYGYTNTLKFYSRISSTETNEIAQLNWGGESQNNRAYFSINGLGCSTFVTWNDMHDVLKSLHECKITRLDLALDDFSGEILNIESMVQAYQADEFSLTINKPSHKVFGDWLNPVPVDGRTINIGNRNNGKMFRGYEKGLQLSHKSDSPYHKWVRAEVEIKNTDRVIPFDAILNTDSYFAGCYPYCARVIRSFNANNPPATRIEINQVQTLLSLDRLSHYCSTAYGKLFSVLQKSGVKPEEILLSLSREGTPRRMRSAKSFLNTIGVYKDASREGNSSGLPGQRVQHRRQGNPSEQALLRGAFSRWNQRDAWLLPKSGNCFPAVA